MGCHILILAQRISAFAVSDPPHLDLNDPKQASLDGFHGAMRPEQIAPATDSYLHIQIKTPVRQMPGLHSNSAGLSASCRKGSLTQHGIQGWDPEPEWHATSGCHKSSAWAGLQEFNQFNYI